jgi:hypothetical protein
MRYSVCIIDDKIPASGIEGIRDSDLLNASNLQLLLQQEALWTDHVIKNLVKTLLEQKDTDNVTSKWDVYGFTNPSFYINTLNDGLFRSDLIVFDWEYPGTGSGSGTDSERILKEILENTFCLIFIFSGADREAEIRTVLAKPEFQEYKERLHYLDKTVSGADQTNVLLTKAEEMYGNNFSFTFAAELRKKSVQVMDKILSELGRATLSDVRNYLKLEETGTKRDLVDFIAERFRAGLVASDIPEIASSGVTSGADKELVKKIWSYRLYLPIDATMNAGDELVRRGDVVKCSGQYFLVVTADCDLKRFWHKNFGSINLLPLHRLHDSNAELREMLTFCISPGDLKQGEFRHLTDKLGKLSEGPFILPFVKIDGNYESFVVMPKEFTATKIGLHAEVSDRSKGERKTLYLKYTWWSGTEKICSVSEPFLTSIIQHILNVIGGYGVPDYPHPTMKSIFENILDDFITIPGTTPKL